MSEVFSGITEPTGDDCTANRWVSVLVDGKVVEGYAIWYPQMGGYVGKALVVGRNSAEADSCFDLYVWHDGEFPFSEDSQPGATPAFLHHCSPHQFIRFGEEVLALPPREETP